MHVLQVALHFDQHLSGLIVQYGTAVYAMLFLVIFVEIGFLPLFFLPGDPLIFHLRRTRGDRRAERLARDPRAVRGHGGRQRRRLCDWPRDR